MYFFNTNLEHGINNIKIKHIQTIVQVVLHVVLYQIIINVVSVNSALWFKVW